MTPARERRPSRMMGSQHAASVTTISVIFLAMADSRSCWSLRTAALEVRAARYIPQYEPAITENDTKLITAR